MAEEKVEKEGPSGIIYPPKNYLWCDEDGPSDWEDDPVDEKVQEDVLNTPKHAYNYEFDKAEEENGRSGRHSPALSDYFDVDPSLTDQLLDRYEEYLHEEEVAHKKAASIMAKRKRVRERAKRRRAQRQQRKLAAKNEGAVAEPMDQGDQVGTLPGEPNRREAPTTPKRARKLIEQRLEEQKRQRKTKYKPLRKPGEAKCETDTSSSDESDSEDLDLHTIQKKQLDLMHDLVHNYVGLKYKFDRQAEEMKLLRRRPKILDPKSANIEMWKSKLLVSRVYFHINFVKDLHKTFKETMEFVIGGRGAPPTAITSSLKETPATITLAYATYLRRINKDPKDGLLHYYLSHDLFLKKEACTTHTTYDGLDGPVNLSTAKLQPQKVLLEYDDKNGSKTLSMNINVMLKGQPYQHLGHDDAMEILTTEKRDYRAMRSQFARMFQKLSVNPQ